MDADLHPIGLENPFSDEFANIGQRLRTIRLINPVLPLT